MTHSSFDSYLDYKTIVNSSSMKLPGVSNGLITDTCSSRDKLLDLQMLSLMFQHLIPCSPLLLTHPDVGQKILHLQLCANDLWKFSISKATIGSMSEPSRRIPYRI